MENIVDRIYHRSSAHFASDKFDLWELENIVIGGDGWAPPFMLLMLTLRIGGR